MSETTEAAQARTLLESLGYTVFKGAQKPARLPHKELYDCPFVAAPTLVDYRRSAIIEQTAHAVISRNMRALNSKLNWRVLEQAYRAVLAFEGEIWELGVFQGVTANLLANCMRTYGDGGSKLRLFDTFEGMPDTDPVRDMHSKGDFADTSVERVAEIVGEGVPVQFHKGVVPATFADLEDAKLKLVHVDLDIYQAILDTLAFCYPRMKRGVFVFDDYGTPSCPGALAAVDEFFADKPETIFCFSTGQAMAVKF
jgi:O-methyltransferase